MGKKSKGKKQQNQPQSQQQLSSGSALTIAYPASSNAPRASRRNIAEEFADYFGVETKLENWQRLCHDLGIEGDLRSLTKCRKALKSIWVNIYDFLDARARNEIPERFPNQRTLAQYTIKTRRIYPKKAAKSQLQGSPIRFLLAHIFR